MTTMRIHSRVAHLMDPATQPDPWEISTNSAPRSPDARLGDARFGGPASYAKAINRGLPGHELRQARRVHWRHGLRLELRPEIQNTSRGAWHQNAVGQIRYDSLPGCGDNPQGSSNPGDKDAPVVLAAETICCGRRP